MKLSIAPMIDYTNTHFRVFMRILAPKALLYTEMVTWQAVLNNPQKILLHDPVEYPLALQLGGSQPEKLAEAGLLAVEEGFQEINLNLGCPSSRVQSGRFGACLMLDPELVAECITAMKNSIAVPVTAKIRLGIDNLDSYEYLQNFVAVLINAGVDKIIIHARKAWLKGLSPKENRTIPPINYDYVYKIKQEYPNIPIIINGNIAVEDIPAHLKMVDGVMIGRLSYQNPYKIAELHNSLYPEINIITREEAYKQYMTYAEQQIKLGVKPNVLYKPVLNLYHGQPFAKKFKFNLLNNQFFDANTA